MNGEIFIFLFLCFLSFPNDECTPLALEKNKTLVSKNIVSFETGVELKEQSLDTVSDIEFLDV